jgi:hypothetical protein
MQYCIVLDRFQMLFMTAAQAEWTQMQNQITRFKPRRPKRLPDAGIPPFFPKPLRIACYELVRTDLVGLLPIM